MLALSTTVRHRNTPSPPPSGPECSTYFVVRRRGSHCGKRIITDRVVRMKLSTGNRKCVSSQVAVEHNDR